MQIKIGAVYRRNGVDFIAVRHEYDDDQNVLLFSLVNVINWISLEKHTGKILTNGNISCTELTDCAYIADSMATYYHQLLYMK